MIVMGLHSGCGASVAFVKDGQPLVLLERERLVRRKQADGLELADVEAALQEAGLAWEDVDVCAVVPSLSPPPQPLPRGEGLSVSPRVGPLELTAAFQRNNAIGKPLERRVERALAHAAAGYYSSPFEAALVLVRSPDRLESHSFWGQGGSLRPLVNHSGMGPYLYNKVADAIGLGAAGGAGKLMGLAPYGKPAFYHEGDRARLVEAGEQVLALWLKLACERALAAGYAVPEIAKGMDVLCPFVKDLAASTQLLFEQDLLAVLEEAKKAACAQDCDPAYLCLSGGAALNCPANTAVFEKGGFQDIFIPPYCDNTGLALGAALAVCAEEGKLSQRPDENTRYLIARSAATWRSSPQVSSRRTGLLRCARNDDVDHFSDGRSTVPPYLGRDLDEAEIRRVLAEAGRACQLVTPDDPVKQAAQWLAEGKIIGWVEGRSEVGPRALGHRSLLASPLMVENWARVNALKQREPWRPFAPVVLEEKAGEWFSGGPLPSPYMLFTHQVRGDKLPAITHVDGSARVQTVGAQASAIYELLKAFEGLTGVPVLLNTSLNGPDEPIVDTIQDALQTLSQIKPDWLYLHGVGFVRGRTS